MKYIYDLMPHIIAVGFMLNIIGNTIKMTFKINSKYIIWILLVTSMVINFIFFNISFESFFISLLSFSFSVSSYDLIKSSRKMIKNN